MIQIFNNTLGQEELNAVRRVFESRWLGRGNECKAFEQELAEYWKAEHVLVTQNCTNSLFLALKVLDIGKGDEVIIPTIHFIGAASAIIQAGAVPVFVDSDAATLNVNPFSLESAINHRTKAIMTLNYGGRMCEMEKIRELCGNRISIISDEACSVAGFKNGRAFGTYADIACYSFDSMKQLVTGDGGAMMFRNPEHRKKAESLSYLGFQYGKNAGHKSAGKKSRWWEFQCDHASMLYATNDIVAAIGREQLKKLPGFVARRKEIWDYYMKELRGVVGLPMDVHNEDPSYYFFWIRSYIRDDLADHLRKRNIYTTFRYYPLSKQRIFRRRSKDRTDPLDVDETACITLNIPLHQNLTDDDAEHVVNSIKEFSK